MAVVTKVTRVSNPRRAAKGRPRKSNATAKHRRRRMTPKQVKFFGTARQKAALKAARTRKRTGGARHTRRASVSARRRRKTTNPAPLVLTLGAVNPSQKGAKKHTMKKKHRRTNKRRTTAHRRRRTVSKAVVHHRRRRRSTNPRRYAVHYRRRRRNPGFSSMKATGSVVIGILLGVTAAKILPGMVTNAMPSLGSSPIMRILVTGASAYAAGLLAKKFLPSIGEGVMLGGLAQTASVALNAFLPSVGGAIGLGAFAPASFSVPQNPITAGAAAQRMAIAATASARPGMGGRGFARAFGGS